MAYSNGVSESNSSSYLALLNSIRPKSDANPPRKKRKLATVSKSNANLKLKRNNPNSAAAEPSRELPAEAPQEITADLAEPLNEIDDDGNVQVSDDEIADDGAEMLLRDPFEKHYLDASRLESLGAESKVKPVQTELSNGLRKTWISRREDSAPPTALRTKTDFYLKGRLADQSSSILSRLSSPEADVAGAIFDYIDVVAAIRTVENAGLLGDLCCLHALNHVFKTRDRVLKNNARLSQAESPEDLDLRDQGFTRPKILIVIPTKQACVRFVESIVKLSEPEQQENKSRFLDTFSREDEDEWQDKPADFREIFGGNHEEDFRIGLKFTRKTIKYFSGFYNSDIVFCSPLGLMRTITTSSSNNGNEKESNKSPDADFLSSIEVAIVDHASTLQMQNWQHVQFIFSRLNHLPKESHGCDFSRVRNSYLDGHAKYLRQTIILSAYLTPEINSLVSTHLHNIAGTVKYIPTCNGSMLDVSSALPMAVTQTFLRFDAPSPLADSDTRFKYFTSTILPQLVRDRDNTQQQQQQGVLLFIPSYADFTRLRNHLSTSADGTPISFGAISEYTPVKEVSRARSHFMSGRYGLLLYSERAHHHFRYRIRGVKKIVFYAVPENPVFWTEVVSYLGLTADYEGSSQVADSNNRKSRVRSLFSRWDVLKLERVVGSERVGKLVSERVGDIFEFN